MQGLLQLLFLLASNAFLARALPIVERGSSVSSFTLDGWNSLCGSCFSSNLYFSNLCFELGSVGWNFALSESADVCVQQQVADQMIFLAKSSSISVSESSELIAYAVGFNELSRSVGHVVGFGRSVSACTVAPANPELSGSSSVGISNGPISSIPTASSSSSSSSIPISGSSSSSSSGSLGDGSSTDFNSTDIGSGNSTLTGSDSSNSTDFTGSNSTDTSNSTLTGTDSTNSTDTSTDTSSSTDSTDISTATDSSVDTTAATATDTSVASATDSSTAATATSSQTFDGNIHDPAGRRRRNSIRRL